MNKNLKGFLLALATFSLLILGVFIYAETTETPVTTAEYAPQEQIELSEATLLKMVNDERAKVGAKPLTIDPILKKSAQYKAEDLVARDYFEHADPVTGKNNGIRWAYDNGASCSYIGENLVDVSKATLVDDLNKLAMLSWLDSPSHKKAMLHTRYDTTGFGIKNDVVVQHFCDK